MTPIQVVWVEKLPANMLVPYYLMASYLYYHCDAGPMTDEAYDLCCKRLDAAWFWIEHRHKHLVDRRALRSTTGYYLRPEMLPTMVMTSAHALMRAVEENRILEHISPLINHQEGTDVSNITIAAINERLSLGLTAKFIEEELGVEPVEKVKKSMLWTEEQYQTICDKLGEHIERQRLSTAAAPAKNKKKDEPAGGDFFGGSDDASSEDDPFAGLNESSSDEDPFAGLNEPVAEETESFFG